MENMPKVYLPEIGAHRRLSLHFRDNWAKAENPEDKPLDFKKVDPVEISHEYSRYGYAKDKQERKII